MTGNTSKSSRNYQQPIPASVRRKAALMDTVSAIRQKAEVAVFMAATRSKRHRMRNTILTRLHNGTGIQD